MNAPPAPLAFAPAPGPQAAPMIDPPLLSLIVPVKDEQDAIPAFVTRVTAVLDALVDADGPLAWEVLFVDDGSQDATTRPR